MILVCKDYINTNFRKKFTKRKEDSSSLENRKPNFLRFQGADGESYSKKRG
jgi:hypothetical protein